MMVVTNVLYPFPKQEKKSKAALQSGLNMIDFLDMAELLFGVIGCYVNYSAGWVTAFFIGIGVSTILASFTKGLEQAKNEINDKNTRCDALITLLNLLFNDVFFCVLRIYVMHKKGHVYFGLIFVIKEFLSAMFRACLLVDFFRSSH